MGETLFPWHPTADHTEHWGTDSCHGNSTMAENMGQVIFGRMERDSMVYYGIMWQETYNIMTETYSIMCEAYYTVIHM